MSSCPHCGAHINMKPPKLNYPPQTNTTVSLGCGTLILIAIIVAIFSNRGDRSDMRSVRSSIDRLQIQIESLENKIESLDSSIAVEQ